MQVGSVGDVQLLGYTFVHTCGGLVDGPNTACAFARLAEVINIKLVSATKDSTVFIQGIIQPTITTVKFCACVVCAG